VKGTDLCYIHTMSPEERKTFAGWAGSRPKGCDFKIPNLRTIDDTEKALGLLVRATMAGKISQSKARLAETQIRLWLKLHRQRIADEQTAREVERQERLRRALNGPG